MTRNPMNIVIFHCDIEHLWWEYAKLTPFYQELLEETILKKANIN